MDNKVKNEKQGRNQQGEITVYGSSWCGFTRRAQAHLDGLGVAYRYIEVDDEPEAEQLIGSWNNGRSIRPTFDIEGDVFINPSAVDVERELRARNLLS